MEENCNLKIRKWDEEMIVEKKRKTTVKYVKRKEREIWEYMWERDAEWKKKRNKNFSRNIGKKMIRKNSRREEKWKKWIKERKWKKDKEKIENRKESKKENLRNCVQLFCTSTPWLNNVPL